MIRRELASGTAEVIFGADMQVLRKRVRDLAGDLAIIETLRFAREFLATGEAEGAGRGLSQRGPRGRARTGG
jgi:hypothetical protein